MYGVANVLFLFSSAHVRCRTLDWVCSFTNGFPLSSVKQRYTQARDSLKYATVIGCGLNPLPLCPIHFTALKKKAIIAALS